MFSILIVSHNRKGELRYTLNVLKEYTKGHSCEVLVFLDGCTDGSESLMKEFNWVGWELSNIRLWASPARNHLYKKAKGDILIGFDDDAHPLQSDFLQRTKEAFENDPSVGILAFKEVKGLYKKNEEALKEVKPNEKAILCSEFVGCGFAIKSDVYFKTQGFPVWMDIYGEEACVSIEVLAQGYDIMYTQEVAVNHRINPKVRFKLGSNYFRFGNQLRNSFNYFVVYYKQPIFPIVKLLFHNFKKYALKDYRYFNFYLRNVILSILGIPYILKFRNPVSKDVLLKKRELSKR